MVVPVALVPDLMVKAGARRHVDLTADDRLDALLQSGLVELDNAVHDAVVRDGGGIHAKLFDTLYVGCDLVGAIQERVLRMGVQMTE